MAILSRNNHTVLNVHSGFYSADDSLPPNIFRHTIRFLRKLDQCSLSSDSHLCCGNDDDIRSEISGFRKQHTGFLFFSAGHRAKQSKRQIFKDIERSGKSEAEGGVGGGF